MQEWKRTFNMIRGIMLVNFTFFLVSCHRTQKVPLEPLPDLEIMAVANPGPYSPAEIHRQVVQDLVEIRNAGMVERASADINRRMPKAMTEKLLAGYFINTYVMEPTSGCAGLKASSNGNGQVQF